MSWVCDLAELIRVHAGLDWGKVLEEASIQSCTRMLLLGLFIAHHFLETDLPEEVFSKIQASPVVQSLGHSIVLKLVSDPSAPGGPWALIHFHLRLSENFKERAAYSLRMIFTPTVDDWQNLPLPSPLSFLYYFTHPLRVLGKYGSNLIIRPVRSVRLL